MKEELATARKHPAALASTVIAGVAVTVLALVTIAYLLGWVPTRATLPSAPGSIASPGQQLPGSVQQGGVDLLPGETLIAPADSPQLPAAQAQAPKAVLPPSAAQPTTPRYAKPAPFDTAKPAAPRKAPSPIYPQPAAPASSADYAQVLPSRAAPSKPNYGRGDLPPATSFERSTRTLCVNCGTVASIGSVGGDWEVRVRFEDGSTETLRYPDRPRLRIGERVHLEDGRLISE